MTGVIGERRAVSQLLMLSVREVIGVECMPPIKWGRVSKVLCHHFQVSSILKEEVEGL